MKKEKIFFCVYYSRFLKNCAKKISLCRLIVSFSLCRLRRSIRQALRVRPPEGQYFLRRFGVTKKLQGAHLIARLGLCYRRPTKSHSLRPSCRNAPPSVRSVSLHPGVRHSFLISALGTCYANYRTRRTQYEEYAALLALNFLFCK